MPELSSRWLIRHEYAQVLVGGPQFAFAGCNGVIDGVIANFAVSYRRARRIRHSPVKGWR